VNAVAGFDLAFRAPKSVSLLWGVAPEWIRSEVCAAHDAAVREALGYLEREACRARRGTDGVIQVQGRGFVGAAFVHSTSRTGDPLLHTEDTLADRREARQTKGPRLRAFPRADGGTRTPDPFITSEVLYQLSYVGVKRFSA
jgi:conjugative relaxase-like TrwC/TraI family protein